MGIGISLRTCYISYCFIELRVIAFPVWAFHCTSPCIFDLLLADLKRMEMVELLNLALA